MPLIRGRYPSFDDFWLLAGQPMNATNSNIPARSNHRALGFGTTDQASVLTSGVMTAVAVPVDPGDPITNVSFRSGATAAGSPTHWWFAVYMLMNNATTLLATTADQTTTAWPANTTKTLPLVTASAWLAANGGIPIVASPNTAPTGFLYAACMVTASTVPSLVCGTAAPAGGTQFFTGAATLSQTSGAGLTVPPAPSSLASPTTVTNVPLCYLT